MLWRCDLAKVCKGIFRMMCHDGSVFPELNIQPRIKYFKIHKPFYLFTVTKRAARVSQASIVMSSFDNNLKWHTLVWTLSSIGHFTHKTESPWLLHFEHSHWLKRRSRSKFASHYAWGTNGVCECKMDVMSTWFLTWHQMDRVIGHLDLFSKTTSWR